MNLAVTSPLDFKLAKHNSVALDTNNHQLELTAHGKSALKDKRSQLKMRERQLLRVLGKSDAFSQKIAQKLLATISITPLIDKGYIADASQKDEASIAESFINLSEQKTEYDGRELTSIEKSQITVAVKVFDAIS